MPYPLDPPTKGLLKLNFDGASKGNPCLSGFGGIFRNHAGKILLIYHGNIGHNSNKATELEGLITRIEISIEGNFFPLIAEGDS